MIRSYLRSALRQFGKEKLYVAINALGLSVGMAACFLIFSWVKEELTYDSHYPAANRIYRVVTSGVGEDDSGIASTYPMVRNRVLSQFPEVEESARLFDQGFLGSKTRISSGEKVFTGLRFYYGDSTTLKLFGFNVLAGDAVHALARPNTVVITRSTAALFFADADAVGKTLRIGRDTDMEVAAVVEDMPANAHFHFDVMATMLSHPWIRRAEESVWSGVVYHTYVKLKEGASAEALETKIASLLENFPNDPQHYGRELNLQLQPVRDIHLHSNMKFELEANGNATYVSLFITIAVLVLMVAMMNYINLSTARHTQRYKEVGVRKVLGAARGQLVAQLVIESVLVTFAAFVGAGLLAEGARPLLIAMSGRGDFSTRFFDVEVLIVSAGVALTIGVATAWLPAMALSAFRPVALFRPGALVAGGPGLRKVLIVAQFTISLLLTFCTAITWLQVRYLHNAALGYSKDHTVVLDISLPGAKENATRIKQGFLSVPGISGVTAASQLPTDIQTGENIDASPSQSLGVYCVSVDPDFFRVMGIPLTEPGGRLASLQPNDTMNYFVLNKQAIDALGWTVEDTPGREISIRHGNQKPGPVLGVAEDFHFQSLHHAIGPLAIEFSPGDYQYLLVKVSPGQLKPTLDRMQEVWQRLAAGTPFDYQFLDEQYDRLYKAEQRSSGLLVGFACIAMFISLLGLFGLASFTLERRTKEIGLRKILGAESWRVTLLVTKDFLYLMAIAFVLALPLGYLYRENWLEQFAFRANVGVHVFLICGLLNVGLALLTLAYHTLKMSRTNPVDTLRYE